MLANFGVITSILRVSGIEMHPCGTEPVTFSGEQPSLGRGHNSRLGGTSSDLEEHGSGMPPMAPGLSSLQAQKIFYLAMLHLPLFVLLKSTFQVRCLVLEPI